MSNKNNENVYVVAHEIDDAGKIDMIPHELDTEEHDVIFTPVVAQDEEEAFKCSISMMLDLGVEFRKTHVVAKYNNFEEFLREEQEKDRE